MYVSLLCEMIKTYRGGLAINKFSKIAFFKNKK